MDIGTLTATLVVDTGPLGQAENAMLRFKQSTISSLSVMSQRLRTFGYLTSVTLTAPIIAAGKMSMKAASDYEFSMQKIVGLTGTAQEVVDRWGDSIFEMSKAFGKKPTELAEGLYYIASSGIKGAEALDVLRLSAKAAASGLGTTQEIANYLTSVLNAYRGTGIDAAYATDVLVAAVREGKAEADGFAASMGQVIPIASQLGVSIDQVAGAMAAITLTGSNAAQAGVYLKNIFNALLKEADKGAKAMTQASWALGEMEISYAALRKILKDQGIIALMEKLRELTSVYGDTLVAQVIPEIRGMTGALSLMGKNFAYNSALMQEVTESTGSLAQAFMKVSNTIKIRYDRAMASANITLIELGKEMAKVLLPVLEDIVKKLENVTLWFTQLSDAQKLNTIKIIGLVAALGPLSLILSTLGYALVGVMNLTNGLAVAFSFLTKRLVIGSLFAKVAAGLRGIAFGAEAVTGAFAATAIAAEAAVISFASFLAYMVPFGLAIWMISENIIKPFVKRIKEMRDEYEKMKSAVEDTDPRAELSESISARMYEGGSKYPFEGLKKRDLSQFSKEALQILQTDVDQMIALRQEDLDNARLINEAKLKESKEYTDQLKAITDKQKDYAYVKVEANKGMYTQSQWTGIVSEYEESLQKMEEARDNFVKKGLSEAQRVLEGAPSDIQHFKAYRKEVTAALNAIEKPIQEAEEALKQLQERTEEINTAFYDLEKGQRIIAAMTKLMGGDYDDLGEKTKLYNEIMQRFIEIQIKAGYTIPEVNTQIQKLASTLQGLENSQVERTLQLISGQLEIFGNSFDAGEARVKVLEDQLRDFNQQTYGTAAAFRVMGINGLILQAILDGLIKTYQEAQMSAVISDDKKTLGFLEAQKNAFGTLESEIDYTSATLDSYQKQLQVLYNQNKVGTAEWWNLIDAIYAEKFALQQMSNEADVAPFRAMVDTFGRFEDQISYAEAEMDAAASMMEFLIAEGQQFTLAYAQAAKAYAYWNDTVIGLQTEEAITPLQQMYEVFGGLSNEIQMVSEALRGAQIEFDNFAKAGVRSGEAYEKSKEKLQAYRLELLELQIEAIAAAMAGNLVADLASSLGKAFVDAGAGFSEMGNVILSTAAQMVNAMLVTAITAAIMDGVVKKGLIAGLIVASVGIGAIMALQEKGKSAASGASKLKKGGVIPEGYPNDTFPALLTSGEVVVPKEKVGDPKYIAEVLDVPGFQKGYGELNPSKKSLDDFWTGWGLGFMEILKMYKDVPDRYREQLMEYYGASGPPSWWKAAPSMEGGMLPEATVTAQFTGDKKDKYLNDPFLRKFYGDETFNQYVTEYKKILNTKYKGEEISTRQRDLAWHGATGLIDQANKPIGQKVKEAGINIGLGILPEVLLATPLLPKAIKAITSRIPMSVSKAEEYIPPIRLTENAGRFRPRSAMDAYIEQMHYQAFTPSYRRSYPNELRTARQMFAGEDTGEDLFLTRSDFIARYGEAQRGDFAAADDTQFLTNSELGYHYNKYLQRDWRPQEILGLERANAYLEFDEFQKLYGARFNDKSETTRFYRQYLRDAWYPENPLPYTENSTEFSRIVSYNRHNELRYQWMDAENQVRDMHSQLVRQPLLIPESIESDYEHFLKIATQGDDISIIPRDRLRQATVTSDFEVEENKDVLSYLIASANDIYGRLQHQLGLYDQSLFPGRSTLNAASANTPISSFSSNRNISNFTKDQIIRQLDPDQQELIQQMDDFDFTATIFTPDKKILPRVTSYPKPQVIPTDLSDFLDDLNRNLDFLNNEIIPKNNKTGIPYKLESFEHARDNYIRLKWFATDPNYPQFPEEASWLAEAIPGVFKGSIEDIRSTGYYKEIPGLSMVNSGDPIFGRPRTGSGTYKSLNEYLTKIERGRIKSGFNSQTSGENSSFELWKKYIEQGKAIGHYNDRDLIYAIMKGMLPISIFESLFGTDRKSKEIPKLATGGIIPSGYPNDTYPAWLTSGETVIPKSQSGIIEQMMNAPKFQNGSPGLNFTGFAFGFKAMQESMAGAIQSSMTLGDKLHIFFADLGTGVSQLLQAPFTWKLKPSPEEYEMGREGWSGRTSILAKDATWAMGGALGDAAIGAVISKLPDITKLLKNIPDSKKAINFASYNELQSGVSPFLSSQPLSQQQAATSAVESANAWMKKWWSAPETLNKLKSFGYLEEPLKKRIQSKKYLAQTVATPDDLFGEDLYTFTQNYGLSAEDLLIENKALGRMEGMLSSHDIPEIADKVYDNLVHAGFSPDLTKSIAVHEGTHGLTASNALLPSNIAEEMSAVMKQVNDYSDLSHEQIRKFEYFGNPTEIYARIMQLREAEGITPGMNISDDILQSLFRKGVEGQTPIDPEFFTTIENLSGFGSLMNKLPLVGGLTAGGLALGSQAQAAPSDDPLKKTIKVLDKRIVDLITGMPVPNTSRLHGEFDISFLEDVVRKALERGLDPYTALAIPHQETGGTPSFSTNPYAITYTNAEDTQKAIDDTIGYSLDFLNEKLKLAEKLGKDSFAAMVQVYNGTGPLTRGAVRSDKAYGVEIPEGGISMKENPLYGKRIEDIRNNILLQNEELVRIVEAIAKDYPTPKLPSVILKQAETESNNKLELYKKSSTSPTFANPFGGFEPTTPSFASIGPSTFDPESINSSNTALQNYYATLLRGKEAASGLEGISQAFMQIAGMTEGTTQTWLAYLGSVLSSMPQLITSISAVTAAKGVESAANETLATTGAVANAMEYPGPLALVMLAVNLAAVVAALASAPKYAKGGVIPPGYPNDTYLARLTSGEQVLTPIQAREYRDMPDMQDMLGKLTLQGSTPSGSISDELQLLLSTYEINFPEEKFKSLFSPLMKQPKVVQEAVNKKKTLSKIYNYNNVTENLTKVTKAQAAKDSTIGKVLAKLTKQNGVNTEAFKQVNFAKRIKQDRAVESPYQQINLAKLLKRNKATETPYQQINLAKLLKQNKAAEKPYQLIDFAKLTRQNKLTDQINLAKLRNQGVEKMDIPTAPHEAIDFNKLIKQNKVATKPYQQVNLAKLRNQGAESTIGNAQVLDRLFKVKKVNEQSLSKLTAIAQGTSMTQKMLSDQSFTPTIITEKVFADQSYVPTVEATYPAALMKDLGRQMQVTRMATGGVVPNGYPNDSFPAMLTSGEVVLPKDVSKSIKGANTRPTKVQITVDGKIAGKDLMLALRRASVIN